MYKVIGNDQKIYGPISADQLRQWLGEGRLNSASLVLTENSSQWRPLSSLPEFAVPPVAPLNLFSQAGLPPQGYPQSQNGLATAGLIFGILGNLCCCGGTVCAVLGIVFSLIVLTQHEAYPQQRGRSLAVAGLILSIIGLSWHCLLPFLGLIHHPLRFHHQWRYL